MVVLLLSGIACQKPDPVFAERAGVYRIVLTNEQDAIIQAAQHSWEEMREKDPQRAAQFPEPRLAVEGMSIELKADGRFVFNITNAGKAEEIVGRYAFKDGNLVMTAETYNGKPAQGDKKVQEYPYNTTTNTIELPGPNGPQMFRR